MNETQLPPDGGQPHGSGDRQPSDVLSATSPMHPTTSNELDDFPEDALLEDEAAGWSAQFVVPFQQSGPLPAVVGFLALSVFAQPAPHLTTAAKNPMQGPLVTRTAPMARPTRTVQKTPTPAMATGTAQVTLPSDWVPSVQTLQQLGWTGVGLSTGDALEAERTAWTFTDREMSLDWRNAGTWAQHGGTFAAAVFLLTPNARARFFANDVRVISNVLFDRVAQQHLIQEVVNAQPRLIQFQVQDQQEFAWVDVSFQLWQSQLDQQSGQRVGGLKLDPATHGARILHMIVLLLRITPGTQGANAPMGGTGWLVSTYALNPAGGSLPTVIQPA